MLMLSETHNGEKTNAPTGKGEQGIKKPKNTKKMRRKSKNEKNHRKNLCKYY